MGPSPLDHKALELLRRLTGDPGSQFRSDQLNVISRLVEDRARVLLVQRTGWGKSAVYFIATRLLRDRGAGPTLLVSPLLALMRNQIDSAQRMGIRAETINSTNREDWEAVKSALESDNIDLLLISPERLANSYFRSDILPEIGRRSGLFVIDEAHCVSDWGHDFRPDYRRLVRVLDLLPAGVPVLCCTATANDRVVDDIVSQLEFVLAPVRGPLARDGLRLEAINMPRQADRMLYLAKVIPKFRGSGIVYCLTIFDTERVAGWLESNGIKAVSYSSRSDPDERVSVERDLMSNDHKVVVATSALGMGFDKPDLAFVIHYQSPGSPIAYYQQVGRAGRSLSESWGILLSGSEDIDIQDYFIDSAFPSPNLAERVVKLLEDHGLSMTTNEILESINIRYTQLEAFLKILEVEGAVERDGKRWLRTLRPWQYDHIRAESVTALRRVEQRQMREYIRSSDCRMKLLRELLDDPVAEPCGICDNCSGSETFQVPITPSAVQRAINYLRSKDLVIEPRKQFPDRKGIPVDQRISAGRTLAIWGDGGWGSVVRSGKQVEGRFDEQIVTASAELIEQRWRPFLMPAWITYAPSLRNPGLVPDFARRLAASLGVPCHDVVIKVRETEPQKTMQNSSQQYENVRGAFEVAGPVPAGPVLLVDDIVDSRWTLTVIGRKLRDAGVPVVYPFALASTAERSVR